MIHFYHGLFGSPSSWLQIRPQRYDVISHDLYLESKQELLALETGPDDILVGYSLGGRIALEVARRNDFNLQHIILLSSHPGLLPGEVFQRVQWEDHVLQKMETSTVNDFKSFWDELSLFTSSGLGSELNEEKLRASARLFDSFRLSQMPKTSNHFFKNKNKITWVIGDQDTKYKELINERVKPLGIETFVVGTDHRVLHASEDIRRILESRGVM